MLDPKGREAARLWAINATSDGGVPGDDYIDGILTAYLSTVTPAEVGGHADAQTEARAIAERLMLPDEDVFNLAVDIIALALAAKDAELATMKRDFETLAELQKAAFQRAERAEAQLAEARKALDEIGNGCDGRVNKDALPCQIARRACEAQGGENG